MDADDQKLYSRDVSARIYVDCLRQQQLAEKSSNHNTKKWIKQFTIYFNLNNGIRDWIHNIFKMRLSTMIEYFFNQSKWMDINFSDSGIS